MKKLGTCVYFTGFQHEACEAGITYTSVSVDHEPLKSPSAGYKLGRSRPCVEAFNPKELTCDKRRLPTIEEVQASEAETMALFSAKVAEVESGVSTCCKAPLTGPHGWIRCTKCGRALMHVCPPRGRRR